PAPLDFPSALFGTCRVPALLRERKIYCENCARPESIALGTNRSAVQLDQMPGDSESQTETALLSGNRTLRLPEAIEHVWEKFRRDSITSIADCQSRCRFHTGQIDTHAAISGRELNCVREQIPDHLSQTVRIAFHQTLCRDKSCL